MIANILSMEAFTEGPAYPNTAKYYLNLEGIPMEIYSRSSDSKRLTDYQKLIVEQMRALDHKVREYLLNGKEE